MKTSQIYPSNPGTAAPDWSTVEELQRRMVETVQAMDALADDVGLARQVREFSGDQRKRALARAMAAALAGGDSAAKAEAEARGSDTYGKELAVLERQLTAAEQTIARWDCAKIQWESCRSLIAMQREATKL